MTQQLTISRETTSQLETMPQQQMMSQQTTLQQQMTTANDIMKMLTCQTRSHQQITSGQMTSRQKNM